MLAFMKSFMHLQERFKDKYVRVNAFACFYECIDQYVTIQLLIFNFIQCVTETEIIAGSWQNQNSILKPYLPQSNATSEL